MIIEPAEEHLAIQERYVETKEQLRKAKLKADRLELLKPYLQVLDLDAFDLSTMSEVAFNTILNGGKMSLENYEKEQERIRLEEEETEKRAKIYLERRMKLAPYVFFYVSQDDILYADATEEQFQEIFNRLKDRKKQDDEQKELLEKQNAELQKQVVKAEKQVEKVNKKTIVFQTISDNHKKQLSEIELLKQQNNEMKATLETCLKFIIPDPLRKAIENTLKSLK
jgi:hypothetical protein